MKAIKFKVLVAEDDAVLRDLARDILSADYDVMTAEDGQEAWEKAMEWRPDLVITDLMMPRMHGYELCGKLKGPGGIPGVLVMVASSKTFAADVAQSRAAGADDFIAKPYEVGQLLAKAAALLGGGGAPKEAPAPASLPAELSSRGMAPAQAVRQGVSVKFWGTRGSCPSGGPKTVRYGSNTACAEIRAGDLLLIMDCGTGLRELGASLAKEFKGRPLEGHIFVGHTHWDHIQGFPFFSPLYNPANTFRIYSVHGAGSSLESIFSGTMSADYFPIPLSSLAAKLRFHELSGPLDLGQARVSFIHLNHPGVCIGFRVESQGRSVAYLSDHEGFARLGGDSDLARRQDAGIIDFTRGCDLLIREAQYTEAEYPYRRGWGHSTFEDAVNDAASAGVKRLAIIHHDPEHTDDIMDAIMERCRAQAAGRFDCFAARDGLELEL